MKRNKFRIRLIFSISFFVLVVSSAASYFSIAKLNDSGDWVRHTYLVIEKLDSVVSKMKDAETGYRGYLLTGNRTFLEPYTGSRAQVDHAVSAAELLTRDNQAQQETFPILKSLINEKYNLASLWISQKEAGEQISAEKMIRGKQVMDSIRTVIASMKQREEVLMKTREQKSTKFITYTPLLMMWGSIIAICLTLYFYFKLKRDLARNEQLQKELQYVETARNRQIDIIQGIAKKIADGDYSARIDLEKLKDDLKEK